MPDPSDLPDSPASDPRLPGVDAHTASDRPEPDEPTLAAPGPSEGIGDEAPALEPVEPVSMAAAAPRPDDVSSAEASATSSNERTTLGDGGGDGSDVAADATADVTADASTLRPDHQGPDLSTPAATGARLGELFPALFGPGTPKPLKLRIQADIQQRAPGVFTRKALSVFLHRYTTSTAYLKALAAAATRFDLDGAPAGEIAALHRDAAQEELARRQAIVRARRAAERTVEGRDAAPDGREPRPPRGRGRGADRRPPQDKRGAAARPRVGESSARAPEGEGASPAQRSRDRNAGRPMPPNRRGPGEQGPTHSRPQNARGEPSPRSSAPVDAAQRDRATLLRMWEASPLTKANFCALKRVTEAEFDALIAQARAERGDRR